MGEKHEALHSKLLTLLLSKMDQATSGEKLSEQLGVTRAAIWKEIAALRTQGYTIDASTNKGYRLMEVPNLICSELVRSSVTGSMQQEIICLAETDSTILYANRMILDGAPSHAQDGTVVIADKQTGGLGRLGRSFDSPPNVGVYMSMILEPRCSSESLGLLTSYTGLAVCNAIRHVSGISPQIKWPNDIIIDGKKVCGILTRLVSDAETGTITHAILGMGVNVCQQSFPDELADKAISLRQAVGIDYPRAVLAGEMINELNRMLYVERWLENPPASALEELRTRSCTIGGRVVVNSPTATRDGEALDIDDNGGLIVQFHEGVEVVCSGEVSVRGILGYTI